MLKFIFVSSNRIFKTTLKDLYEANFLKNVFTNLARITFYIDFEKTTDIVALQSAEYTGHFFNTESHSL